ncbi:MAG TPA: type II toxin-antitoxin system HicB family antitoxin [Candidatus Binataceae bacterium]|nr:type II toxin-antitoxin system HicB family antitoxin [Candidatus Binataceae bacterium]
MSLAFDPESDAWIVRFPELPGCLAHGASPREALAEGEEAKALWLATALENGSDIPEAHPDTTHSGKLVLRLPRSLHAAAADGAEREGASLNNYLVHLISEGVQRSGMKNLYQHLETKNDQRLLKRRSDGVRRTRAQVN